MSKQIINDDSDSTEKYIAEVHANFNAASEKTFKILEDYLAGGFIKNLAKILVYLPKERQNAALENIPAGVRENVGEFLSSFSEKKNSDADVLSAVGSVFKDANLAGKNMIDAFIAKKDALYSYVIKRESDALFAKNPLLMLNVERFLSDIEILLYMDDRAIQKFLREVDTDVISKALKGTSGAVQEKIFKNMSKRAAAMLKEDMEFMGPMLRKHVLDAQQQCLDIIRRLADSEEIVISFPIGLNDDTIN